MKIIDLLNKIANGEEVPRKIRINHWSYKFEWIEHQSDYYDKHNEIDLMSCLSCDKEELNYEVHEIEEEKKFTKEDFIKEAMDLEDITREEFNKRYEVKECNCGRGYCKGFIKVEKVQEEKKIPEKLEQIMSKRGKYNSIDELAEEVFKAFETIDDLIIKQNKIIDYLKSKGE